MGLVVVVVLVCLTLCFRSRHASVRGNNADGPLDVGAVMVSNKEVQYPAMLHLCCLPRRACRACIFGVTEGAHGTRNGSRRRRTSRDRGGRRSRQRGWMQSVPIGSRDGCKWIAARPTWSASISRMKIRGANGSPCRTDVRISHGSEFPCFVRTTDLAPDIVSRM